MDPITESNQHQHFMATVFSHACKISHALQLPFELHRSPAIQTPNSGRHSPTFLRDCPVFGNVNRIYTLNLAGQLHVSKYLQQSEGKTHGISALALVENGGNHYPLLSFTTERQKPKFWHSGLGSERHHAAFRNRVTRS